MVIDFYATWCGPCVFIAPIFVELAEKNENLVFIKVDVDGCRETVKTFKIQAMPTFVVYNTEEEVVKSMRGANKASLEALVKLAAAL